MRPAPPMTLATRVERAWRALTGRRVDKPMRRGAYEATGNSRLLADWIASRLNGNDEVRGSLPLLRDRSRDLVRNNAFARHFLRMLKVNVVGATGPRLQAQVRNNDGNLAKPINDRIEAAWLDWCQPKNASRDGRLSFTGIQHQGLTTVAKDGETFVRMLPGFRRNRHRFALEVIDAGLIDEQLNLPRSNRNGEIRCGVEFDEDARPVAFHGWNIDPRLTSVNPGDRKRVVYPASEMLHVYDPEAVSMPRGIPWMCSVMVPMKHLKEYAVTAAVAARVGAAKVGVFTKKDDSSGTSLPDGDEALDMDANPGTFIIAPNGYGLDSFDPSNPSTAYAEFVKSQLRDIATGLGVTYNALANDLEGVNYSSMRSGLLIERDLWRLLQQWWIEQFVQPVYEAWLSNASAAGVLVLDAREFDRFLAAKWVARGWPWVDPAKDMTAGVQGIQNGLASRTQLLAEQGLDFETVCEELAEEQRIADEAGLTLGAPATSTDTTSTTNDNTGDTPDETTTAAGS